MWVGFNDVFKVLQVYRGDAINNLYDLIIEDFDPETEEASIEALIYDRDEDRVDHRPDLYSFKV